MICVCFVIVGMIIMNNSENNFPKVFNKSRSHYMELHRSLNLIYIFESKNNKLIGINSIDEIKKEIASRK